MAHVTLSGHDWLPGELLNIRPSLQSKELLGRLGSIRLSDHQEEAIVNGNPPYEAKKTTIYQDRHLYQGLLISL